MIWINISNVTPINTLRYACQRRTKTRQECESKCETQHILTTFRYACQKISEHRRIWIHISNLTPINTFRYACKKKNQQRRQECGG